MVREQVPPCITPKYETGCPLPAEQARLFRLLPVNPGPDISTQAAAARAGQQPAAVRPLLKAPGRAHLLEHGSTLAVGGRTTWSACSPTGTAMPTPRPMTGRGR
jgi:hypothetical protein